MSMARNSTPDGTEPLHVHEQYVLLALWEDRGKFRRPRFGIGGACFAALYLHDRLRIGPGGGTLIEVVDETATGDPVLDDCLGKIVGSSHPNTAMNWVHNLDLGSAWTRVAAGLCHRGILCTEDVSSWLVFKRTVHTISDPDLRRLLVDRLRRAIFDHQDPVDAETAVLVALTDFGGILKALFDRNDLKRHRRRLNVISASHEASDATSRALAEALIRVQIVSSMIHQRANS